MDFETKYAFVIGGSLLVILLFIGTGDDWGKRSKTHALIRNTIVAAFIGFLAFSIYAAMNTGPNACVSGGRGVDIGDC